MPAARTTDTPKAAEAFAAYVALGPGRTLRTLADQYVQQGRYKTAATALRIFADWSVRDRWQDRIRDVLTAEAERNLEEAAMLDAATFLQSSRLLYERMQYATREHADALVKMRESVRRPAPKLGTIDVKHSGTIKHAHHDMSHFTDDEIDALAAIAERRMVEAS